MDALFPITSPIGVLVVLTGVPAVFLWIEAWTGWRVFHYAPPLLFIYALPMVLSTSGLLAGQSPVYEWMDEMVVPLFLVLMLLEVDLVAVGRVMGRGVLVMLMGTAGVILGAPIAYWLVKSHLEPGAWRSYGILAASWIGGSGNMAAVAGALDLSRSSTSYTMAVLGDVIVYLLWIPILLGSKSFAGWFGRFTRVDRRRIEAIEEASAGLVSQKGELQMRHVLYLLFLGLLCTWVGGVLARAFSTWVGDALARRLPGLSEVLTTRSWQILITTTLGLLLAMTPARRMPGSRQMAVALVYFFVARIGAGADVSRLAGQAVWFVAGSFVWIFVHGAFCVLGAKLLRADVHTTAIASAANIGGIATASIVAAHHNGKLLPVAVLMALLGYALGNYGAFVAAALCRWVGG